MKKTIIITMIVITLLNLICVPSFAEEPTRFDMSLPMSTEPQEKGLVELSNDDNQKLKASVMGFTYQKGLTAKAIGVVAAAIPRAANRLLGLFIHETSTESRDANNRFTIYDLVLGHYEIFNIDFTKRLPENESDVDTFMERVKIDVVKYYSFTRAFSIAISLFVLIYMGIRMAVSTVASEQAKYKKMLISWVASVMILFLMHFIIIVISFVLQIRIKSFPKNSRIMGT